MKLPFLCQGRPYEKLLYIFSIVEITLDASLKPEKQELFFFHLWMYIFVGTSMAVESVRIIQMPYLLGFLLHHLTVLNHQASLIQYGALLLFSVFLGMLYGEMDFQKYPESEGPYDVGYAMARSLKYGNEVQVFYPAKLGESEELEVADWLPHGDKSITGILALTVSLCNLVKVPFVHLHSKGLSHVKSMVYKGAAVSEDFRGKPIVPVVFSHGLQSATFLYTMCLRDLAAHGFLVLAVNHQDGSNLHTVTREGADKYYGAKEPLELRDKREPQLRRREEEMRELIGELASRREGVLAGLPEWLSIDTASIVVAGHSFGGTTAMRTAVNLPEQVKGVLTFDPWVYPYDREALDGGFRVPAPLVAVNSEHFPLITTFDIWKAIEAVFKASACAANQCWRVKNFHHRLQTDLGVLIPLEFSAIERFRPSTRDPYKYFMHTQLWLAFLDKNGFNRGAFDASLVHKRVHEMLEAQELESLPAHTDLT